MPAFVPFLLLALTLAPAAGLASEENFEFETPSAESIAADEKADLLPGALIDRRSGNRLRIRCLDSSCKSAQLELHDRDGKYLASGRKLFSENPAREATRDHEPDEFYPGIVTVSTVLYSALLFSDGSNFAGAVLLSLTPAAVVVDVAALPYVGVRSIDARIARAKLRKFDRKRVRITHRRFKHVCFSLVGDACGG